MVSHKEKIDVKAFKDLFGEKGLNTPDLGDMTLVGLFPVETYIEAFKRAFELIYKHTSKDTLDFYLVYPLIFLMRHSVELSLKQAIMDMKYLNRHSESLKDDGIFHTHSLTTLCQLLRKEFQDSKDLPYESVMKEFEEINSKLLNWQKADPNNELFRYAVDNVGKFVLPNIRLSPRKIYEFSTEVLNWFHGISDTISAIYEGKYESESFK